MWPGRVALFVVCDSGPVPEADLQAHAVNFLCGGPCDGTEIVLANEERHLGYCLFREAGEITSQDEPGNLGQTTPTTAIVDGADRMRYALPVPRVRAVAAGDALADA